MKLPFPITLLLQCLLAWILTHFIISFLKQTHLWNPRKLPPGPFPLPIIGNLHCLGKMPHKSLSQIAKRHGDLVSLHLGTLTTIVISSASRAKEITHKHDATLAHRIVRETSTVCDRHLHSVVFLPPGPQWRFLRKIAASHLFSNSRLDAGRDLRRKKVKELLCFVEQCSKTSMAVNISQAAFSTSLNILSNTFFSFNLTDFGAGAEISTGHELKDLFTDILILGGTPNIADLFPILKSIDPQRIRRRSKVLKERIMELFDGIIKERMLCGCKREGKEDVLDALLAIHEKNPDQFEIKDIRIFLFDLFVAGTDTTSSTIEWAMAELIRNPEKMMKVQTELERNIGRGNLIGDSDVANLPYFQAVVKETMRLHPAVPLLVPRKASTKVELNGGFLIPKDAQVWVNVWAMGRDERVWKDAESFQPERFLDSPEIDYRGQDYEFIPFGSGRRICLGMTFAMRVLHMVLGSLINCFDWKVVEEGGVVEMDESFGLSLQKARPLCVVPVSRGGDGDMRWRQTGSG